MTTSMKSLVIFSLSIIVLQPVAFGQAVIWQEDFSPYSNNTTTAGDNLPSPSGDGLTDWAINTSGSSHIPPGHFSVQGNQFEGYDTQGEVVWTSQVIDISGSSRVYTTIDVLHESTTSNDYVRVYYKLDGGPETLFGDFEGQNTFSDYGAFTTSTYGVYALSGSTLQIVVRMSATNDLYFGFFPVNAYLRFDNVGIFEQRELHSIASGNWNTSGVWSVSNGGPSCSCTPISTDFLHIHGGTTVNINGTYTNSGIHVYNGGILRWTSNRTLTLQGGSITVDNGGQFTQNTRNGDISLSQPGLYTLHNDGTFNVRNLNLNENNIIVQTEGTSNLQLTGNVTLTSAFFTYYTTTLNNYGLLSIGGNLDAGSNIFNSIYVSNYGTLTLTGSFSNISTTNLFTNYNGSTWNFGGTTSTNVNLYCNNGSNTFNYDLGGNQNIITPQDNYSNLTLSGSGSKTMQGSFSVSGDMTLSGTATFTPGTNTVTLNGASVQNLNGAFSFYGLTVNNTTSGDAIVLNNPVSVTNALTLTDGIVQTTATNIVSVARTTTVTSTPTSNASFIDGPMEITGVGNTGGTYIKFPVGAGGQIHQAELRVNGSSRNYTAQYYNLSAILLGFTLPVTLDAVSGVGYWKISSSSATSVTSAYVRLYYNTSDVVSDNTNLRVAKENLLISWLDLGGSGSAPGAGNIVSTTSFTSFSYFSLANATGGGNPLPVRWLSFTGTQEGDQIKLIWKTTSEINNDHFNVERSTNNKDFISIGTLPGSTDINQVNNYTFYDKHPFTGINYYRIKQTDINGNYDYSSLIRVIFSNMLAQGAVGQEILLSPNPVTGNELEVTLNSDAIGQIKNISVFDGSGRLYNIEYLDTNDNPLYIPIERSNYLPGTYILKISGSAGSTSARFIVK